MKPFPFPLRLSVPAILLLLGLLSGLWSFQQQISLSSRRMKEDITRRASFAGNQTATLLEYIYRTTSTETHSREGANLIISQIGGDPNLEVAFLADETDHILFATRYELRNQAVTESLLEGNLKPLQQVRQNRSGRLLLSPDGQHLQAIYPVLLEAKPGELRPSKIGVLALVYTLSTQKQQAYVDAFMHSLKTSGAVAILCLLVWFFFERTLTQRAHHLVAASHRLARGELTARTHLQGSDELAQISAAFDYMADRLQADIAERMRVEADLKQTLHELQQAQTQLIQTEKMSSLGQLVAGIAHEINNPINFIYGNLTHANDYAQDLLHLVQLYQTAYPCPTADIQTEITAIELDYLIEDFPKMLASMKIGADRIRQIVLSLRNFSRLDESEMKPVDIHEGIDSTLLILHNRFKARLDHPGIQIYKEYGQLPLVECYAGQLNQVFMNILSNAIDALESQYKIMPLSHPADDSETIMQPKKPGLPTIKIRTQLLDSDRILIQFIDNGPGITAEIQSRLFDPFFTTKPIGKGTGLGLSISYQIVVEKHGGNLRCDSQPGVGSEFQLEIPVRRPALTPTQT